MVTLRVGLITVPGNTHVQGSRHCNQDLAEVERQRDRVRDEYREPPHGCKWCPDCGEWRGRSMFYANAARADGLAHYCKAHDNERRRRRYYNRKGSYQVP